MMGTSSSIISPSIMPIYPTNTNKFSNIDLIREVFNHIKKSNSNMEKCLNVSNLIKIKTDCKILMSFLIF